MNLLVTVDPDYVLPWESQVGQYPQQGTPGIEYFRGDLPDGTKFVDCLLWRDPDGLLRGILNYYPTDIEPWEDAGNFNLYVDPEWRRQGIALALMREADRRWNLNFEQQRYTPAGAKVVKTYLELMRGMTDA